MCLLNMRFGSCILRVLAANEKLQRLLRSASDLVKQLAVASHEVSAELGTNVPRLVSGKCFVAAGWIVFVVFRAAFSALTAGATTTPAPAALASPVAAPPAASSSASPGMAMPVSAAAGTQGAAGETLPASSAPVAWPVTVTHNTAQHGG